jgi:hypothetical protein
MNKSYKNIIKTSDEGCSLMSIPEKPVKLYSVQSKKTNLSSNIIPHSTWEFMYFEHILDMHRIFSKNLERMEGYDLTTDVNPYTFEFLKKFSKFLYDCSSKKTSQNLETLSETAFQIYINYNSN